MEVNTNEDASATHPVVYAKPVITITVFAQVNKIKINNMSTELQDLLSYYALESEVAH